MIYNFAELEFKIELVLENGRFVRRRADQRRDQNRDGRRFLEVRASGRIQRSLQRRGDYSTQRESDERGVPHRRAAMERRAVLACRFGKWRQMSSDASRRAAGRTLLRPKVQTSESTSDN